MADPLILVATISLLVSVLAVALSLRAQRASNRRRLDAERREAAAVDERMQAGRTAAAAAAAGQELPQLRGALESRADPEVPEREPELTAPVPPRELFEAIAGGTSVLFVGAGLAADAGYPTYIELLEAMVVHLAHRGAADDAESLLIRLRRGEPELVAPLVAARLDPDEMAELIRGEIMRVERRPSRAASALAALPVSGVITDDWSGYVSDTFAQRTAVHLLPWSTEPGAELDDALQGQRTFIVEAFGGINQDRLVVDYDAYQDELSANSEYAKFISWVLGARTVLFAAASVDNIERFMTSSRARRSDDLPHWALVPWQPDIDLHRRRLLERFGVHLIVHSSADGAAEIERFARPLGAQLAAPRERQHRERPRLGAIRLENIGPFRELELDFAEDSLGTILLGNNGSGKTSVLRAIALALAGQSPETERLATTMLRSDATRGSVTLTVGKQRFTARLRRDRRRVRVDADQYTPVQAAQWLVLGFPALRGVSTGDPTGPEPDGDVRPGPDDLLPVLDRAPDGRLDDLKQWIVNAEMRASDLARDSAIRERGMLTRFFDVVQALVPGIDFVYHGVDRDTFEIQLGSQDGPLSFDVLSRGMTAVLGWVGVVLQRLYEVYPDHADPTSQHVLVLIDEIDVHLHPEWQRSVLPLLAESFGGMQLLATTHSPLVVASAHRYDVIHLYRRDGRVQAEALERKFTGLGSDEILTGPAFGMETPLDLETEARVREYTRLLAAGHTPERDRRAAELAEELGEMPTERTPQEEEIAACFHTWLEERLRDRSPDERERMLGEAQRYMNRLNRERDR